MRSEEEEEWLEAAALRTNLFGRKNNPLSTQIIPLFIRI